LLLFPQTPPASENVTVNLVLLDATVTDDKGNPILGLGPDDFVVTENGQQQQVTSVDYFTSRRLLDRPEEKAEFKVDRISEERHIIFFFDKPDEYSTQSMSDLQNARQAARDFVEKQMVATDRVAVAGHDSRLKIYSDFSSDKKTVSKGIDEAVRFSNGVTRGDTPLLANVDSEGMMKKSGRVYDAIAMLADATRGIRGRKVFVVFSHGMGTRNDYNPDILEPETGYVDAAINALNRANVSMHVINLHRDSGFRVTEQYLSRFADETNGSYHRNLVRYQAAVKEINLQNAGYYLISYRPASMEGKGFQKVDVKLRNPEFTVRARRGYMR
jgi:VWFA-related protein